MPLMKSKSKKAFEHNLKAELHAGKPKDQSLAIAYSVKRKAAAKKMADGGKVDISAKEEHRVDADSITPEEMEMIREYRKGKSEINFHDESRPSIDSAKDEREMAMLSEGGEISAEDDDMPSIDDALDERELRMARHHALRHSPEIRADEDRPDADSGSIADMIMKRKKMADGGMVDLSRNADEDPNYEDQLSFEALKKENYSESPALDELDIPMDSGEHGDESEKEAEDESPIYKKMMSKKRK